MSRWPLRLLPLLVLLLAACATTPHPASPGGASRTVILISIDGFRADYLDRDETPTLARLAADGVRAEAMKPSFPTLTFPNHYTLVTGLYPDHHGIVDNRIVDPAIGHRFVYKDAASIADPRWWGGEPIWVGARKHGIPTATMFWPGSDVAIDGMRPNHWRRFDGKVPPGRRVDQILRWLDLPARERPRFLTLYFEQVDHAGHGHGPDSGEVDDALRLVDHALGDLVEGLRRRGLFDRVDLVVVSDHGMTATSPDRVVFVDDLLNAAGSSLDAAHAITLGIVAGFDPSPAAEPAVEKALIGAEAHMRCWNRRDIPARLHYGTNPRVPAIVCVADDGWILTSHAWRDAHPRVSLGEHGYDNDDPNMRALFVAHGPDFRRGIVVPEFPNVDVYPLLAHLLGVPLAPNDGRLGDVAGMLAGTIAPN